MRNLLLNFSFLVLLSGCSLFSVYKIDIPQGTPLTQAQAAKVAVGMSKEQVTYLLGSPAINDPLSLNQWDYNYEFIPGTYGKQDNIPATTKTQRLSIVFDANDKVSDIKGLASIPEKQYGIPSGKNKQLYNQ